VVLVKRCIIVSAALLSIGLIASPASAAQVTHEKSSFSGQFVIPGGAFCDFTLEEIFTIHDNSVIFGDPDNPDKVITQEKQEVTHVNIDTGYALSEVDHEVLVFDASDARFETIGLVWHLRDPDGKIVVVQAGLEIVDTNTGDVIKVTPHFNPNAAAVVCSALGGNPA
jgi:hypothetical protein